MGKLTKYERELKSVELGYEEYLHGNVPLSEMWITVESPDKNPYININGMFLYSEEDIDLLIGLLEEARSISR